MSKLSRYTERQRQAIPPFASSSAVERAVMTGILLETKPRFGLRRFLLVATSLFATLIAMIVIWHGQRIPVSKPAPDFTESVVILEDHVCIWLEPVVPVKTEKSR
jgi:hypothetical protein